MVFFLGYEIASKNHAYYQFYEFIVARLYATYLSFVPYWMTINDRWLFSGFMDGQPERYMFVESDNASHESSVDDEPNTSYEISSDGSGRIVER